MFDNDDLPGCLHDALRAAQGRGLKHMLCALIGDNTPQWQVSTRFRSSSGYHIAIRPDLCDAMMEALDPPTQRPASAAPASGGVFDEPEDLQRERREDRDEAAPEPAPAGPRRHVLWVTADKDRPGPICDSNGEVALGQCKVCGMAEIERDLTPVCPGPPAEPEGAGLFD